MAANYQSKVVPVTAYQWQGTAETIPPFFSKYVFNSLGPKPLLAVGPGKAMNVGDWAVLDVFGAVGIFTDQTFKAAFEPLKQNLGAK